MRVFLVQTAHGLNPPSGGYKSNISFLRQLRSQGHAVAQTCYAFEDDIEDGVARARAKGIDPEVQQLPSLDLGKDAETGLKTELRVTTFIDEARILNIVLSRDVFDKKLYPRRELDIRTYLERDVLSNRMATLINFWSTHIAKFRPTHVVFNDGLTMKITSEMLQSASLNSKFKRVCIIHSAGQLPFGPFCDDGFAGDCQSAARENEMLRGVDGIWSVSRAMQDYALTHGNLQTSFFTLNTWTYLDGGNLPMRRNNVNKTEVGMVNPCDLKGISILLPLAKKLPHVQFVTWESWGTKKRDLDQLREFPNVKVEPTTTNTERDIWDRIKVLIVPSVCFEAWGAVVTEAQLRGIPVVASNAGGIPEAKIGLPYCIPVMGLTGKRDPKTGDHIVPEQDIAPWATAVSKLMTGDPSEYEELADYTARKAVQWVRSFDAREQEKWLLGMMDGLGV